MLRFLLPVILQAILFGLLLLTVVFFLRRRRPEPPSQEQRLAGWVPGTFEAGGRSGRTVRH